MSIRFFQNAKLRLHPEKVDKLEEILHKALVENKESFFKPRFTRYTASSLFAGFR